MAAASAAARQAPAVNRPHAPTLPAADRPQNSGAQDGANGAAHSEAGSGKSGGANRGEEITSPLPPPRRTDPLAADRAAPDAHGRPATPTARAYPRGGRRRQRMTRRHPTGQGGGERRSGPPFPPPPASPLACGPQERRPSAPPEPSGRPPSPRRDRNAGGGTQLDPHTARPSAPRPLLPRASRPTGGLAQARQSDARTTPGSGKRRRTRAVWPNCGRAEGGLGSDGAPEGAVHGPLLPPFPPPNLVRYGPHTYAAFQARVDADRPARDNRWDHFVDVCLQQMLARDPHPYNAPDVQARFAAASVLFGVHLLNRLLGCLQDLGQLEDAQRGRPPVGPAGRPGYAAPGAFRMTPPPGLGPMPFRPYGAHDHHPLHLHHLLHHPVGFPMMQHHFPHQHVHPAAVPQLPVHLQHHHRPAAVPQHPVHLHHHHHHHRPHQHVEYPHCLPQQHPRPPQHTVPVPVPVPVPAPGRGAQQQGVSQGEARGVPPGEARRMGAPAAAPPLAVPQPGHTAAGSPLRTVQVPDPAVPGAAPPEVPTGPEPVVPGGGPPLTRGMQGTAPMGRATAGEQAGDAAQEAGVAGPRDISELLAQALEVYRQTAAGSDGAAPEGADAGKLIAQALAAVAPRAEGAKEKPAEAVASGGQDAWRGVPEAQTPAEGGGVVEPSGRRAKEEGVEDWMWELREWRQGAPSEPCQAGLAYSMDLHAGTSWARLPDNLRARLDAAEAARGGGADERPLAPFPPRPDTPPAMVAAGQGAEEEQGAEGEGDEKAYGPGESVLALMYEDDAGPDVYAGMDMDPANAPL